MRSSLLALALIAVTASCATQADRRPASPSSGEMSASACMPNEDVEALALALSEALLSRRARVPAFGRLQASMLGTKPPRWDVRYGEREQPNPRFDAEFEEYERNRARREEEAARGEVRLQRHLSPPSPFITTLDPGGLRLRVEFSAEDPRLAMASSQAVGHVERVDDPEGLELYAVAHPSSARWLAHVAGVWIGFDVEGDGALDGVLEGLRGLAQTPACPRPVPTSVEPS